MKRRVEGKVALVTGAANGIGRGAVIVLAREGAKIVATDLQDENGERLLGELRIGRLRGGISPSRRDQRG